jgi:hypothetical protein
VSIMIDKRDEDDVLDKKFGKLLVVKFAGLRYKRRSYLCVCDCGVTKEVFGHNLKLGKSKSCGSCNHDLVDKRFCRLKVISRFGKDRNNKTLWNCLCDCGKIKAINASSLTRGLTKSCGCLRKECPSSKVGDKSPFWNPNLSDTDRAKRHKLQGVSDWRNQVFQRDNYRCKICGLGKHINAHHLDGWHWCSDKRFDIKNGVTLCDSCHRQFHHLYGYKDNTAMEFAEYYLVRRAECNSEYRN